MHSGRQARNNMAHLPHLHILSVQCRQLIHIQHHLSTPLALLLFLLLPLPLPLLLSLLLRKLLPWRPLWFNSSTRPA